MKINSPIYALAGSLLLILCSATEGAAATFVVTNANDSGPGSLRAALTQANSNAQADNDQLRRGVFQHAPHDHADQR